MTSLCIALLLSQTPNMSLPLVAPGQATMSQFETDYNNSMALIDAHQHTAGQGALVPVGGLSIQTPLPFLGNPATGMGYLGLVDAGAGPSVTLTMWNDGINWWVEDGSGNKIELTANGGLNVTLGGNGWDAVLPEYEDILQYLGHAPNKCVDNDETARVYRLSKTGINFYRREGEEAHKGEGWAMGPREVEMAACGLFFVRDPRGESDEVFGGNPGLGLPNVLPTFSDPGEASELIKWWVAHDELREKWATLAYDRIQDRTFDNAALKACKWMEEAGIL